MPPPDLTSATLGPQPLPKLQRINVADPSIRSRVLSKPVKRIQSDADLEIWKTSRACEELLLFVGRLCEAAVGKETTVDPTEDPQDSNNGESSKDLYAPARSQNSTSCLGIDAVVRLLLTVDGWTQDVEPRKNSQRFGNMAFRDWGARLEEVRQNLTAFPSDAHSSPHGILPHASLLTAPGTIASGFAEES